MELSKGELTRKKVLGAAVNLINKKGFNNTSINDIINETGVKKGNLYFHFQNKEDLGLALLQEARQDYLKFLKDSARGNTPCVMLCNILDAIYKLHKKRNFIGGCLFGNTAIEMSDTNPEYAKVISDIFEEWILLLSDLLKRAAEAGELKKDIPPEQLARYIVASLEGCIMMARLKKDKTELLNCIETIKYFIGIK